MGGRFWKRWLTFFKILKVIKYRHDSPGKKTRNENQAKKFRFRGSLLKFIWKVSPREVVYLKESLDAIIPIKTWALEVRKKR
jgi:DNA mismatch repair protein MutS